MNPAVLLAIVLFVAMIACMQIGYRGGRVATERHPDWEHEGLSTIEAAVFGLFGLLLALSFAGAMDRLGLRRQQIVDEANAIEDSYQLIDLMPATAQPAVRQLFRQYIDARIKMHEVIPDLAAADRELDRAGRLQQEIWSRTVAAIAQDSTGNVAKVVIPTLNDMGDVMTARKIALHAHVPMLIASLLVALALMTGVMAGYSMSKRPRSSWLYTLLYATSVAATIYTVIDLDYPRGGVITLEAADEAMLRLRDLIRSH